MLLSHCESKEELDYLITQYVERLNNGMSIETIYNEIASDHNASINPVDVTNRRTGEHLRALAYACIETGFTRVDNVSSYLAEEYYDIIEKSKNKGTLGK